MVRNVYLYPVGCHGWFWLGVGEMKKEIGNRLEDIKEKARVTDKYLNQTDIEWTEEDLSDLFWLIDKIEHYEKALKTILKDSELYNTTSKKTTYSYPGKIAKKALEGEE